MGTKYEDKFVQCPFYRRHEANKIVCEGLCKGNTINLVYESQEDKKAYMKNICYSILESRDCPIYLMLNQRYEEDGANG